MYVDEYDWPLYDEWLTATLDGTLGVVTTDLSVVVPGTYERVIGNYDNIKGVYADTSSEPLPELPPGLAPDLDTGTAPMYIQAYFNNAKLFRVVPYTSIGTVRINFRPVPEEITLNTTLYLDKTLLKLAAVYSYLSRDGTNEANTIKVGEDLMLRERQLGFKRGKPIPISNARRQASVNRWWY
jgi:hypothetical protein